MKRDFYPGSEWLYFKIYGGIKACDDLISSKIYPAMKRLQSHGIIRQWFFIRYSDPDFHLRLRLNLADTRFVGEAILAVGHLLQPLCDVHDLHKFTIDTYSRELERYGASVMQPTESLFCIDSEAVAAMLQSIKGGNADYRWLTAFISIDRFLSALGCDTRKKLEYITTINNSYRMEYGYNDHNSKQLNEMYRHRRKAITPAMKCPDDTLSKLLPILHHRDSRIKATAAEQADRLNVLSLLHMMMNRHFASQNRTNELLVYDFLRRFYTSEIAINKTTNKKLTHCL